MFPLEFDLSAWTVMPSIVWCFPETGWDMKGNCLPDIHSGFAESAWRGLKAAKTAKAVAFSLLQMTPEVEGWLWLAVA